MREKSDCVHAYAIGDLVRFRFANDNELDFGIVVDINGVHDGYLKEPMEYDYLTIFWLDENQTSFHYTRSLVKVFKVKK